MKGRKRKGMILDVGPLLRGEKNRITFDYTLSPIPMDRVAFDEDAHVTGEITDSAGYMQLKAKACLAYTTECDRCLDRVEGEFTLDFERVVANEGTLTQQQIDDNVDEYVIIENARLDIDDQLAEALLLDFPKKILCSDDCPGLCPKCGRSLKDGDCGCPTKEIDPRLAVLATLLKKEDEE